MCILMIGIQKAWGDFRGDRQEGEGRDTCNKTSDTADNHLNHDMRQASVNQTCVCIHLQKKELINCGLRNGLQRPVPLIC